jgi:hypothetical protein
MPPTGSTPSDSHHWCLSRGAHPPTITTVLTVVATAATLVPPTRSTLADDERPSTGHKALTAAAWRPLLSTPMLPPGSSPADNPHCSDSSINRCPHTEPTIITVRAAATIANTLMLPTRSPSADDHHCSKSSGSNRRLQKLMPPTRSTPANDHHCTRGSEHRKHADAPNEEHTSRRSPLHERQ